MGVPPRREGTFRDYGRKEAVASTSRPRRACELALSANLMAVFSYLGSAREVFILTRFCMGVRSPVSTLIWGLVSRSH